MIRYIRYSARLLFLPFFIAACTLITFSVWLLDSEMRPLTYWGGLWRENISDMARRPK